MTVFAHTMHSLKQTVEERVKTSIHWGNLPSPALETLRRHRTDTGNLTHWSFASSLERSHQRKLQKSIVSYLETQSLDISSLWAKRSQVYCKRGISVNSCSLLESVEHLEPMGALSVATIICGFWPLVFQCCFGLSLRAVDSLQPTSTTLTDTWLQNVQQLLNSRLIRPDSHRILGLNLPNTHHCNRLWRLREKHYTI